MILLDTGTPGTNREIYSEDTDGREIYSEDTDGETNDFGYYYHCINYSKRSFT